MRFALLGLDDEMLEVVRAIASTDGHTIAWAAEVEEHREVLRQYAPHARLAQGWESLLDGSVADAVLVARGTDEDLRAEQLRKLVQNAMPLLVSHPVHDSMLVCYELDMIRQDTHAVIVPYLCGRLHPAMGRCQELFRAEGSTLCGRLEQMVFERSLANRTKTEVLQHFARDIDLARAMCGDLTKVSAMSPRGEADYGGLGVQLSGPAGVLVRWSVSPAEREEGATLALVGSNGHADLRTPEGDEPWSLAVEASGQPEQSEQFPDWHPAPLALSQLEHSVGEQTGASSTEVGWSRYPDWLDAARTLELADTIERSLIKGRTLELHYEEHTEESTFKGLMAATGCGLLCLALFVLIVFAAIGRFTPRFDVWPYVLIAVLSLFLLLQLFKFAFPSTADESGGGQ